MKETQLMKKQGTPNRHEMVIKPFSLDVQPWHL